MIEKIVFVFNGVIQDSMGRILIENRQEKELPSADQKWGLPGGKLKFGETPEQAVIREAFEETGYKVRIKGMIPLSHANVWYYPDRKQHTVVFGYYGEIISDERFISSDKDVNYIKWIYKYELKDYDFLPGVIELINYVIG